jgi:tRNA(fMet)-specific endonuclease VapC
VSEAAERPRRGILDTSVLVQLGQLADAGVLPSEPLITTMTLAELAVGPLVADDEDQARRQAQLQQVEASFDPLPFDAAAGRAFARVSISYRRAGRQTAARGYDAIIAAIALAEGLPLYTCNPDDFRGIEGLEVVPVAVPD